MIKLSPIAMPTARTKIRVFRQDGTLVAEYLLGEGVHTVGRDPGSAIYLDSNYVSSEHARLHLTATGIAIEDLNSTSGTYLDDVAVRGKLDIAPGQRIQVGDLLVDLAQESPAEAGAGAMLGAGRYSLIQELGRGSMGTVWLAMDNELQEEVAVKLLAPELSDDAVTLANLKREVQKSRKLSHENIIRTHDLSNLPGEMPFITLEYVRGNNLDVVRLYQDEAVMTWDMLRPIALQLCDALNYAHRQKIVHRDLKPANMMMDENYQLKLADFGIAATINEAAARSSLEGTVSGTLHFMSPQQLRGQDPRATDDIYSLGATLYNLLTGRPPFKSGDIQSQILNQLPASVTQVLAGMGREGTVPEYVNAMVMVCLAKDPEARPPDAAAIRAWIESEGTTDALAPRKPTATFIARADEPSISEPESNVEAPKRPVVLITAIVAGLLVFGGLAAVFLLPRKGNQPEVPPEQRAEGTTNLPTSNSNSGFGNATNTNPSKVATTNAPSNGPVLPTLKWSVNTGKAVISSPAMSRDGVVYFGSFDQNLYAVDGKSGQTLWTFKTGGAVYSSPAIGSDGTIYVGSRDAKIYAVNPNGTKKWEFATGASEFGVVASPSIGQSGTVYIGSHDGNMYALNGQTGGKQWEFPTGGKIWATPAVNPDGSILFGSMSGKFYRLKGATGEVLWEIDTESKIESSASIGFPEHKLVFFGTTEGDLLALNVETGKEKWRYRTGSIGDGTPVLSMNNTLYVANDVGQVFALDEFLGFKKWQSRIARPVNEIKSLCSSPMIGADGTILIGSWNHRVYRLDGETGRIIWNVKTKNHVTSTPLMALDGTLYFGSMDGWLYALKTDQAGMAVSPWPRKGQNPQGTAQAWINFVDLDFSQVKELVEAGNIRAPNALGLRYRFGQEVPRDYAKALAWYKKASQGNYAWGLSNAAHLYKEGLGVEKHLAESARLHRKAAELQLVPSMHHMGWIYQTGLGAEQDDREALKWYYKAARSRAPKAYTQIGFFYATGRGGLQRDNIKALAFFQIAFRLGNENTNKQIKALKLNMNPQQLQKALNLANQLERRIAAGDFPD